VEQEEGVAEDYTALKQGFLKLLEKAAAAVAGSHKSTPLCNPPALDNTRRSLTCITLALVFVISCAASVGVDHRRAQPAGRELQCSLSRLASS
jgi:hypothetical protein